MEESPKKCPKCGQELILAYKTPRAIIEYNVSERKPANVWACQGCWYDEQIKNEEKEDKEKK